MLTPLPGTTCFEQMRPRLGAVQVGAVRHASPLWEPRLGAKRFFELYCERWRRSILNLGGHKSWRQWAQQVRPGDVPHLIRL